MRVMQDHIRNKGGSKSGRGKLESVESGEECRPNRQRSSRGHLSTSEASEPEKAVCPSQQASIGATRSGSTYLVPIVSVANFFNSLMARGALFLKVIPDTRLVMCTVYTLATMSEALVRRSFVSPAFTILQLILFSGRSRAISDLRYKSAFSKTNRLHS